MGMEQKMKNGFTLDSCVIIRICENPNIGSLLSCRINFDNSKVFLNSQTVLEVKKHGYSFDFVCQTLKKTLGTEVVYEEISENLKNYASVLQNLYPTLHAGDAEILAFAESKSSVLLSCDKEFLIAAKQAGVKFVNPDILPCDIIAKKVKTKFYGIVKNAIKKNSQYKQKTNSINNKKTILPTVIKSTINKPVTKIAWSTFV